MLQAFIVAGFIALAIFIIIIIVVNYRLLFRALDKASIELRKVSKLMHDVFFSLRAVNFLYRSGQYSLSD